MLEPMLITMHDIFRRLHNCKYNNMLVEEQCYGLLPKQILEMSTARLCDVEKSLKRLWYVLFKNINNNKNMYTTKQQKAF